MFLRLAMFKGKLSPWDQMDWKLMWKNVQKEAQVCWFSHMLLKPYTSSEILEKSEKFGNMILGKSAGKNWCAHQCRGKINSSMLITLNHAGRNQFEAMTTLLRYFLWLNTKLTHYLSAFHPRVWKCWKKWLENLTNCWDVTFDELQLYMYSCSNTPVVTNDLTLKTQPPSWWTYLPLCNPFTI